MSPRQVGPKSVGQNISKNLVQLSARVPKDFRDQITGEARAADCSVGALIMRMHGAHDPTAKKRIERSIGRLGSALNDVGVLPDEMRMVHGALVELQKSIREMIP